MQDPGFARRAGLGSKASSKCQEALQVFPLEVVRRRMQTLAAEGMSQRGVMVARQAILDIWARERLRGFYAGMLPNTVQVSFPGLATSLRAL